MPKDRSMLHPVTLAAAGFLALAAPAAVPAVPAVATAPASAAHVWGPGDIPAALDWEIKPADRAEAPPGTVSFQLGFHSERHSWMTGRDAPLSELAGLTSVQLAGEGQPVSFVLHHDAGDFRCKGAASDGRGIGTCVYAANPAFAGELARRGVTGGLEPYPQFELALSGIGLAYVDELKRQRYATPSTDDLVRAGLHGAGLKQLLAMDAAGYRFGDVATFVHARDHGVSAKYIEALRAAGYRNLTGADLVHLRDHGVSVAYIAELKEAGYGGFTPDQLAHLRDHGVSGGFVADLKAAGYTGLSADELAHLRDHGVSAGFVADLKAAGYDRVPPADLARMRDHGINAGFVRVANQGGQRLSPDELIQLRERGGRRD
jgi:hypothetical protein